MENNVNQLAFDTSAEHLLRQGKQSVVIHTSKAGGIKNTCYMYRGPGGLMCAAGVLIDDDKYTPDIERSFIYERKAWACLRDEFKDADEQLLSDLQQAHDHYEVPKWYGQLTFLANHHKLSNARIEAVRRELEKAGTWLYEEIV